MTSTLPRSIWRLEFRQPPGWRIEWLGPYTSQWLTAEAEELVRYMEAEHSVTRPHPTDVRIFDGHPGEGRLVCGCASRTLLDRRFGDYLPPLMEQGAHVAEYAVPHSAIVDDSPEQILFIHRQAALVERWGSEPPAALIRSSAGSRHAVITASNGRYDFDAGSVKGT